MTTIRDVARQAGVSTMTVSRVINKSGYTSEETRARVERAIGDLGYVPNALARHLRSRQTRSIALVLSDITNPFFTTIARGVADCAAARGFAVMFCSTDESEAEEMASLQTLVERQIDGILLVPVGSSTEPFRLLGTQGVPVVVLDRRVPSPGVDQVRSDSVGGACRLVRHLIDLGHRRIAMVSGPANVSTSSDRVAGYRRALADAGIAYDPGIVRAAGFSTDAGLAMARDVLTVMPRATAVFAANNFIAFGAIQAIRERGLAVPDDVSVVCFDDVPAGWLIDPFLTCLEQDAYAIGRHGAELLLERLEGRRPARRRSIILPARLVVRRSTAPAPAAASSIPA